MGTNDNAHLLVDRCQEPGTKLILAEAIADAIHGVVSKEVRVQRCEMTPSRRLDATTRLHSVGRMLNQWFSNVLVSYTLQVVAAKKAQVSKEILNAAGASVAVAVNNRFRGSPGLQSLSAVSVEAVSADIVEFDQDGRLITTTSTTSTKLVESTLEEDSSTDQAATAGIVTGIMFCILFICFIIAFVWFMLNHRRNPHPNLNQNQPDTNQSESEGDPQATPDLVAGAEPNGGGVQAHIREFQV